MSDPNKPNVAVCLVGRITKYEVNIHSLKKFNKTLTDKYNVYYFCSLNTKRDKYHINFEKVDKEWNEWNEKKIKGNGICPLCRAKPI